jgi:FixJ family two-component response regulator
MLDVNLAGQASFPVADALLAQGVPVLFVTGYGDIPGGPWTGHRRVGLLRKPITPADLAQAIANLVGPERADPEATTEPARLLQPGA